MYYSVTDFRNQRLVNEMDRIQEMRREYERQQIWEMEGEIYDLKTEIEECGIDDDFVRRFEELRTRSECFMEDTGAEMSDEFDELFYQVSDLVESYSKAA